jgi:hypothetical protein
MSINTVGEFEEMIVIFVPSYKRKNCTFETQGKIAISAYKYTWFLIRSAITNTTSSIRINSKEDGVHDLCVLKFLELNNTEGQG